MGRHYATSQKVAGSKRDKVNDFFFFQIYLILPVALGLGVYSASNRTEYQRQKLKMVLGSTARPSSEAHSLTAICEPIVWTVWDPQYLTTL
jgi:hypothetical protein